MRFRGFATLFALAVLVGGGSAAHGYDRYSVAGDATNCRACHGDFRASAYTSNSDGMNWGNLHNLHRSTMLSGDCATCHGAGQRFPVMIASSVGGDGLAAISCMGCHGRAADNTSGNPDVPGLGGSGAGLRQHHDNAGVMACRTCHQDANPANYAPVGEDSLPEYYANPGMDHPNIPTNSCNPNGTEDYAGASEGLDNDGNGVYDLDDSNCAPPPDAGVHDAGVVDAGITDAGITDAGITDAGTTDGSVWDAGVFDAAATDASTGIDAALPVPDAAGSVADATPSPTPDAGTETSDDGGCGCQSDDGAGSMWTMMLLLLAWHTRRRIRPVRS